MPDTIATAENVVLHVGCGQKGKEALPFDMLYRHIASIAQDPMPMQHNTGFTNLSLCANTSSTRASRM